MEQLYEPQPEPVLTMTQIVDAALRAVAALKMNVSSVTAAVPDEHGWSVAIEVLERRGIPSTNDLLALYELRLDRAGNVVRYARTRIRKRCEYAA